MDDSYHFVATHGAPPAYMDFVRSEGPFRVDSRLGLGRLIKGKRSDQVADAKAEPTHGDKLRQATIELAGARTTWCVPMLKDGEVVGCIIIYRQEVRPFTDKQIALVQNFAAQAVIAIENTRLLNELRDRSLEQQTATSEVLRVISSLTRRIAAGFQAMLGMRVRICDAKFGTLLRFDGKEFYFAAQMVRRQLLPKC